MISYLEALNYRCLRYISVGLGHFHILVGPNASGKSTFLDVIAFMGDIINIGPEKAILERAQSLRELLWKQEGNDFQLTVEMKIPETIKSHLPQNGKNYNYCSYEVKVGIDLKESRILLLAENFFLQKYSKIQDDIINKKIARIELFPEEHKPPDNIIRKSRQHTPTGWRRVVSLNEEGQAYIRSETTDWNFPLRPGAQKAALAMVPEEERFPISKWAKSVLGEGIQVLALNSRAMRKPCRPDAHITFLPDGSNLPIVVRNLNKNYHDRYKMWLEHVKTVFPEIHEIDVLEQQVDKFLYLNVEYSNGITVPSWLLSDGTLRLLALTLLAYIPSTSQIFLIEEPENGVHPKAIEAVYQSLSSVYECQVLCATHSPLFLGLSKTSHLLCFDLTQNGATDVVNGENHPALKSWKGQVKLETLYAAGVLG